MLLPRLHVAVILFSILFSGVFGDEINTEACKLPDGVFPFPENCTSFIRCQNGEPDVELCSDGLLFNPITLTCDFNETGNCSDSNDFGMVPAMVERDDIACSEDGPSNIYPIQDSCSEYYMCKNDTAFKVSCPTGLLMNANKLTCDYPKNVDCDITSSVEESTTGIKAIYEDENEKTETSVTNLYTKSEETKNLASSTSIKYEEPSTPPNVDENVYTENTELKTNQTVDDAEFFESDHNSSVQMRSITESNQEFITTPSNMNAINDQFTSPDLITSDSTEQTNFEELATETVENEIKTSSDIVATDLVSNLHESSKSSLSTANEVKTSTKTLHENANETNSNADLATTNAFTIYIHNSSQSTTAALTNVNLLTETSTADETTTTDLTNLENEYGLDSELSADLTKDATINDSEETKLDALKPVSYEPTTRENHPSDSNVNDYTTDYSDLTSVSSVTEVENEGNFEVVTIKSNKTDTEIDSKITPEKTLTTIQSLRSSDPLTDNETKTTTTSTYSETKITPEYLIDTSISTLTEEYQSTTDEMAVTNGSAFLLDKQTEEYETSSVKLENNGTLTSKSYFPTSSPMNEDHVSSKLVPESTVPDKFSSFSNSFSSTIVPLEKSSNSIPISTSEVEAESATFSEHTSSETMKTNEFDTTVDVFSSLSNSVSSTIVPLEKSSNSIPISTIEEFEADSATIPEHIASENINANEIDTIDEFSSLSNSFSSTIVPVEKSSNSIPISTTEVNTESVTIPENINANEIDTTDKFSSPSNSFSTTIVPLEQSSNSILVSTVELEAESATISEHTASENMQPNEIDTTIDEFSSFSNSFSSTIVPLRESSSNTLSTTEEADAESSTISEHIASENVNKNEIDTTVDKFTSFSNSFSSTTVPLEESSSSSIPNSATEEVKAESVAIPEHFASENIYTNNIDTTDSNFTSVSSDAPTESYTWTTTGTNESLSDELLSTTALNEIPDSYVSAIIETYTNLDKNETLEQFSEEDEFRTPTDMQFSNEYSLNSSSTSVTVSSTNSEVVKDDSNTENKESVLTSSSLNLNTAENLTIDYLIKTTDRPTRKSTDITEETSETIAVLSDSTISSTGENTTTYFSTDRIENSKIDNHLELSTLKTQSPEDITLSSENVTKIVQTYDIPSTKDPASKPMSIISNTESTASAVDFENLDFSTLSTSSDLKLASNEDEIYTHDLYSSTTFPLLDKTEINDMRVVDGELSTEEENTYDSEVISKSTHVLNESELPNEIENTTGISTNPSRTEAGSSTLETSFTSELNEVTTVGNTEIKTQNSNESAELDGESVLTSGFTQNESATQPTEMESSPTNPVTEILNNTADSIVTFTDEITFKTDLPSNFSTSESEDSFLNKSTTLNKTSDPFKATSVSMESENFVYSESATKLSEATDSQTNFPEIIKDASTARTIEKSTISEVPEDSKKPSDSSTVGTLTSSSLPSFDVKTNDYTSVQEVPKASIVDANELDVDSTLGNQTVTVSTPSITPENLQSSTAAEFTTIDYDYADSESKTDSEYAYSESKIGSETTVYVDDIESNSSTFTILPSNSPDIGNETTLFDFGSNSEDESSDNKNTTSVTLSYVADSSYTSDTRNFTSITSEDLLENISTSSTILQNKATSHSFWSEIENATNYNSTSIHDINTTLIKSSNITTVPTTIFAETSIINNKTDLSDEASHSLISSSPFSDFSDLFSSTFSSPSTSKQTDINSPFSLQNITSTESTSDLNALTDSTLQTTLYSDNGIKSTILTSKNLPTESSEIDDETITSITDSYSSNENKNLSTTDFQNFKRTTDTIPINSTTEFISTKLTSKETDSSDAAKFTSRNLEESTQYAEETNVFSRSTLNSEWPTKLSTNIQIITSVSASSDLSTQSMLETSDNVTSMYNKTFEPEVVSENETLPPDGIISNDHLNGSTLIELSSLKVTPEIVETSSNLITETSKDNIDSTTSAMFASYSSESNSKTVKITEVTLSSLSVPTEFERETVHSTTGNGDLSATDETETTNPINKVQTTTDFTSKKFTTSPGKPTEITHLTEFSRALVTGTEKDLPTISTTSEEKENILVEGTTETSQKLINTDSAVSISSETLSRLTRETDDYIFSTTSFEVAENTATKPSASSPKDISGSDLPTIAETNELFYNGTTEPNTKSMKTDYPNSQFTSRKLDEITKAFTSSPGKSSEITSLTEISRALVTNTESDLPATSTISEGTNLVDGTTETSQKLIIADSTISISGETLSRHTREQDEYAFSTTSFEVAKNTATKPSSSSSKDVSGSDHQTITETNELFYKDTTEPNIQSVKTDFSNAQFTSIKFETTTFTARPDKSTEITPSSDFSRALVTGTERDLPIISTTSEGKENNIVYGTTETSQKLISIDSTVGISGETLSKHTMEKDEYKFSTTSSAASENTATKPSSSPSKDISGSDLSTIAETTELFYNGTTEPNTKSMKTDYPNSQFTSRKLDETTKAFTYSPGKSTRITSLTEISRALVTDTESDLSATSTISEGTNLVDGTTETSEKSIIADSTVSISDKTHSIHTRGKDEYISTTSFGIAENTGTRPSASSSKDISGSDIQTITETNKFFYSDTTEPNSQSMKTDYLNIQFTSRKLDETTESSTKNQYSTDFPAALRTETSQSSLNIETKSEPRSIFSTESTTVANQICETPEGRFPYPGDCNKFYQCKKGVPILSTCVGSDHFDPVRKICQDPCLANCDRNADCGTSGSTTSVEEVVSKTTLTEKFSSTSTYIPETEETTSYRTTPKPLTEDTTTYKLTSEETSTITSLSHSTEMKSTFNEISTDSVTPLKLSTSVMDVTVTKEPTETISENYIHSTSTDTTAFESSTITREDVSFTSTSVTTTVTSENTSKMQTETMPFSKVETSTKFGQESESTAEMSTSTFSLDDNTDDISSTTTYSITPVKCEGEDCSSKLPTTGTPVPFKLCPRNDFISLPKCAEYLDCTDKVPKKLECPNGLHFNPTTRVCDWPYAVECGKSAKPLYQPSYSFECPCKTCLIPSTTSCSHYYLCLGFTAYEMKCSANLSFDRSKNTCNFAILTDCIVTTIGTTVEIDSTISTEVFDSTEISTEVSTTELSTSTTKLSSVTPTSFICPSREGLFKYPGNCGLFYQCSNWYPYTMHCPATLHFSESTKQCEYPCDAKCDLKLDCGVPSTASPRDPRCSCLNCKLPSSETCTKYIVCVNGKATINNCPWGQTFDGKRSTCDWAHKVACHHSSICPERNGLFSYKADCHKFVHCSNGIPHVKDCPFILEFDPVKKRCEWPSGRCNHAPIQKELDIFKRAEQRKGWKCPKTFGYFPNNQQCNKFYHCSFGTPSLKECSEGLSYNPKYQTCDWSKRVRCHSNRYRKPRRCRVFDHHVVCSEDRKPRPHNLCSMYYDCTAGRACAKQCPVGLYFNNMTGVCDLPQNVKCPGLNEYSMKELSLKCTSGADGRQVNPANSACFYHCRQGKVVSGCCSKGNIYNVHKDKCERLSKSRRI